MTKKSESPLIASLFPEQVIALETNPAMIQGCLYPQEAIFIRNAIPKRRQEFIAGRDLARRALAKFGISDFPLLMGKDRAPVWPPGIIGSISHSTKFCGVAIAPKTEIQSLGLDVECVRTLAENCWKLICTNRELAWINSLPLNDRDKFLFLTFSAKECLYKCQYSISKKWLDFHDVEICFKPDMGEFIARFLISADPFFPIGTSLTGKYLCDGSYVYTGMTLTELKNHVV